MKLNKIIKVLLIFSLLLCAQSTGLQAADDEAARQLDLYYNTYLKAELPKARQTLLDALELLTTTKFSNQRFRANSFWLCYCRLFVLEKYARNQALSESYYLKSRYWHLESLEVTLKDVNLAMEEIKKFDEEKTSQVIDSWDKKYTDDLGPQYKREVAAPVKKDSTK